MCVVNSPKIGSKELYFSVKGFGVGVGVSVVKECHNVVKVVLNGIGNRIEYIDIQSIGFLKPSYELSLGGGLDLFFIDVSKLHNMLISFLQVWKLLK